MNYFSNQETSKNLFYKFKNRADLRDIRITGSIEIEKDNKNGVSFKAIKFDTHFEEFTVR
jgi:hypothetical protein